MATVELWILALVMTCAIYPDYAQGQLTRRFRRCTLPHERRAWFWERTEQYCSAGRILEYRSRNQRCVCEPGYYRDEETNNCYDAKFCGHCDSSKHERFNKCTNDCEAVCGKRVIQQCDKPCVPGCECEKGYIRKYKKGPCVPIHTCPPKCPAYMTFQMNRERCPRICNVAREDSCAETNEGPGCACKKGFVLRAPFGTVRTRVWCIHESMCTFPDDVKGAGERPYGKGSRVFQGSAAEANNSFWASNQGRRGVQEPMPKGTDEDLLLDGKEFPPIGNLANFGNQQKLGIENGETVQGGMPSGIDEQWRWNLRKQEHQVSSPENIDQSLFQERQKFSSQGSLVLKMHEGFNVGPGKVHRKGGQKVRGAGITSNVNLWDWNEADLGKGGSVSKKIDKDLYRGVNQFSHQGYRIPKAGEGSQLRQQEGGFTGTYSGHKRGVSRHDRFWNWNNHQAGIGNSESQQGGSTLYRGTGGFTAQGPLSYGRGHTSAVGTQATAFEEGLRGPGQIQVQQHRVHSTGQATLINLKGTGIDGGQRTHRQAAFTSNTFWNSQKRQPMLQGNMPTGYNTMSLGNNQYSALGDMGTTRGESSRPIDGSFMGSKNGGRSESDEWKKRHGEQGHQRVDLGRAKGVRGKQGQTFDIDDWLSGKHGSAMPDFAKGQEGDEGLVPTKVINTWTPDEGQLQKGKSKKIGQPGSVLGESDVPGVGMPVGKLPELPKLEEGGFPGVGIAQGNISSILDILEAKVNAQKAISGPAQIQIISHGGITTKGGQQKTSKNKRSTASSRGIKGSVTSGMTEMSNIPGVELPVGKLPDLPKLGGNAGSGSIPGVGLPAEKQENILDILEAKINAQKAVNEPGQLEIIGHGGSGTKGGPQQVITSKASAADPRSKIEEPASSEKGVNKFSGIELPVGKLPELLNTGGNSSPVGVPGVSLSTVKPPKILKILGEEAGLPKLSNQLDQMEILSQDGTGLKEGHLLSGIKQTTGVVNLGRQTKATTTDHTIQQAKSTVHNSGPEIASPNQKKESTHFISQGTQTRLTSTAQHTTLTWPQQDEPLSSPPNFQTPTAVFPIPSATPALTYQESASTYFTDQHRPSQQGTTTQPVSVEWKQQKLSLSEFSQLQTAKGQFPFSDVKVASNNQQGSTSSESQVWQQRHTDMSEPGSTASLQGNQPYSGVSQDGRSVAHGILSDGAIASLNIHTDSTGIEGRGWQVLHGNTGQPTAVELTQRKESLPGILHFRRVTASLPLSSATDESANKRPGSTNFKSHDRRAGFGVKAQPGSVEWTPHNERFPAASQIERATPFSVLDTPVVSSSGQPENTNFARNSWKRNYGNTDQTNVVYWTEQNKPPSKISESHKVNAPYPLPYATVSSNHQQTKNAHLTIRAGRMLGSITQKPDFVDWTYQNEPSTSIPQYQSDHAFASRLGGTASYNNPQLQSADFRGHRGQTRHGITMPHAVVEGTEGSEPLVRISQFQKTKGFKAPSAWTFGFQNEQKRATDFLGGNGEAIPSNAAPSRTINQAQENKPVYAYRTFEKPTATVLFSGATPSSSNTQEPNMIFPNTLAQTHYGGAAQTSVMYVTQPNTPLSQSTGFRSETAFGPISNPAVRFYQQEESTHHTGIHLQASKSSETQPAAVASMQRNQHFTRLPDTPGAMIYGPVSGVSMVSASQGQQSTYFAGNVFPYSQEGMTQQGATDWAERRHSLSVPPELRSSTGFPNLSGASVASTEQGKGSANINGKAAQPYNKNMKPQGALDGTQQIYHPSKLPVLQSATASSAAFLNSAMASGKEVKRTVDLKRQGFKVHHDSLTNTGLVDSTQQTMSSSKHSKLKKQEAAISLFSPSNSSGNQENESQDIKTQGLQISKAITTLPSAIEGAHENEVPKLHDTKTSNILESTSVHLENVQIGSGHLAKRHAQTHSSHTAQSSESDLKERNKSLPKSLGLHLTSSPSLAHSNLSAKQQPNKINGLGRQDSQTINGSTGPPEVNIMNARERLKEAINNQKETFGQRIEPSRVHHGKTLLKGLYNVWPFGGSFKHQMPIAGTGQPLTGNYPNSYGSYGALLQPGFSVYSMPLGYPTVYPTQYVQLANTWRQPNGVPIVFPWQPQHVFERKMPAWQTSQYSQKVQKTKTEFSVPGVKRMSVSGVPHKRTAGALPVAKNYAFDDTGVDSW